MIYEELGLFGDYHVRKRNHHRRKQHQHDNPPARNPSRKKELQNHSVEDRSEYRIR